MTWMKVRREMKHYILDYEVILLKWEGKIIGIPS